MNVTKKFGKRTIFDSLNIKIESDKITAVVGSSGIGKTTLLNMIGLLDNDFSGEIMINSINTTKLNRTSKKKFIREHINYLFQDYALIEHKTVEYNLMLALAYVKMNLLEKRHLIAEALENVGLSTDLCNQHVYMLSGGEQQRVALARVLLKPGDLILADEPTGNLDEYNSQFIFSLLKKISNQKKTIVLVTHNLALAASCDSIIEITKPADELK